MHPEAKKELMVRLALVVLEHANYFGVVKTCKEFDVPRSTFYRWEKQCEQEVQTGLYRKNLWLITIHGKHLKV